MLICRQRTNVNVKFKTTTTSSCTFETDVKVYVKAFPLSQCFIYPIRRGNKRIFSKKKKKRKIFLFQKQLRSNNTKHYGYFIKLFLKSWNCLSVSTIHKKAEFYAVSHNSKLQDLITAPIRSIYIYLHAGTHRVLSGKISPGEIWMSRREGGKNHVLTSFFLQCFVWQWVTVENRMLELCIRFLTMEINSNA